MPTPQQIADGGRRLRALRVLLGFDTPAAAVQALGLTTLTANAWIDIEAPSRPRWLWDYEADAIADAAGVPRSWFTAPHRALGDMRLDPPISPPD